LPFPAIVDTIRAVLERHDPRPITSLEEALGWDAWARREAEQRLAARPLSR
jgi:1-deoxy-D-xylulose 5-phosphate reductoisomerase